MAAQSLRRSQYITTYGPGAILEGPDGPRVIPVLERSGLFDQRRLTDFEITDLRLSQALLNGARILRLPSNAEVGEPDSKYIYRTVPFPRWALCVRHGLLYRKTNTENAMACPRCPPQANKWEAYRQVRRQAIRFVRACAQGHMDDVDWIYIVHAKNPAPGCKPSYLLWQGGGGSLRQIDIVCPLCDARINLGEAYSRTWQCSGRFVEQSNGASGLSCPADAEIAQRGAANLHIAELITALTIPPRSTALHRVLERSNVQSVLLSQSIQSKQELINALRPLVARGLLHPAAMTEIESASEQAVQAAISDTVTAALVATPRELLLEELRALRYAATNGAPRLPSPTPGAPDQFEVVQSQVRILTTPVGHRLRITPVNRLRVVMVQVGYRRLDPQNTLVPRVLDDGQQLWFPGVELFGEGVFIDLAPEGDATNVLSHFPLIGSAATTWRECWTDPPAFKQTVGPDERDHLHPVFVWWHTFAHRLMNSLAIDSGYSSAAVRERIYVETDPVSGQASGGVLLYTAQPGGDGTLGGLIALVPEFERVLTTAGRNLDACSNDPLCSEERFGPEKYNGAACYACVLASETSCEHRNMRLDRTVLLENLP